MYNCISASFGMMSNSRRAVLYRMRWKFPRERICSAWRDMGDFPSSNFDSYLRPSDSVVWHHWCSGYDTCLESKWLQVQSHLPRKQVSGLALKASSMGSIPIVVMIFCCTLWMSGRHISRGQWLFRVGGRTHQLDMKQLKDPMAQVDRVRAQ